MKAGRIFGLLLIAVLVVALGWALQAGMMVERSILNPAYYHELAGESEEIHKGFMEALPEMMLQGMEEEMPEEMAGELTEEELELMRERISVLMSAFQRTFDSGWLAENLTVVTGDILAWIKGEQEMPTAVIDLREEKKSLQRFLVEEFKGLSPEELEMMEIQPNLMEEVSEEIIAEFDIPDEIYLYELAEAEMTSETEIAISRIQAFDSYFPFVLFVAFALLLALSFPLAGLYGGLKWFGSAALISGLTFLAGMFVMGNILVSNIAEDIRSEFPLDYEILSGIIGSVVSKSYSTSIVIILIGLIFIVSGIVFSKKEKY